ncbi:hypothetical protein AB0N09_30955 [Streptomyces erythrochromogenes]|uniref:hypothetical protein n=1 Tax=Streptomyces erythrochromogenes TaxID=285574 RepID=UPI00343A0BA2
MYNEKLPRTWSAICIGAYLAGIAYMGAQSIPEDTTVWLIVSALFLVILLPCLAVPLSKAIYNRIRIDRTSGTLRVGRESFALADLEPGSVQIAVQYDHPTAAQRYAASAAAIDAPFPGARAADRGAPRLVGGGWAVPMGMDSVVISTRGGQGLRIATHNRSAFLAALSEATRSMG